MMRRIFHICTAVMMIFIGAGCSKEVSLEDLLSSLDTAGIQYEKRPQATNGYDVEREGTLRYLYQIGTGKMTVYLFPTVQQRREVQRDPFPAASAIPPNGSYGIDRLLVFYYDGNSVRAKELAKAFEPLGVELSERDIIYNAQAFFDEYITLLSIFDERAADLYSDEAQIKMTLFKDGQSTITNYTGKEYKKLLVESMPLAKEKMDRDTFSELKVEILESNKVKITAKRYNDPSKYESLYTGIVGPDDSGEWLILEENNEIQR